jgi:hypothetical protein
MASGHNREDDLATGGACSRASSTGTYAGPDESGPLRAGWTWGSVSGSLQDGAPAPHGFAEEYPVIATLRGKALPRLGKLRKILAVQVSRTGAPLDSTRRKEIQKGRRTNFPSRLKDHRRRSSAA